MPKLMQPGCDCPGAPDLVDGDSGLDLTPPQIFYYTYYLRSDHAAISHPAIVSLDYDAFLVADEFGLEIPDGGGGWTGVTSFCVSGAGNLQLSVPTGTVQVRVSVYTNCSVDDTEWDFTITAEQERCA